MWPVIRTVYPAGVVTSTTDGFRSGRFSTTRTSEKAVVAATGPASGARCARPLNLCCRTHPANVDWVSPCSSENSRCDFPLARHSATNFARTDAGRCFLLFFMQTL